MERKVIVTAKAHPILTDTLQKKGYVVEHCDTISQEELMTRIAEAEGLIVTTRVKIDKPLLDAALN